MAHRSIANRRTLFTSVGSTEALRTGIARWRGPNRRDGWGRGEHRRLAVICRRHVVPARDADVIRDECFGAQVFQGVPVVFKGDELLHDAAPADSQAMGRGLQEHLNKRPGPYDDGIGPF